VVNELQKWIDQHFFSFQMVSATPYNLLTDHSRIPETNIVDCIGNNEAVDTYFGIFFSFITFILGIKIILKYRIFISNTNKEPLLQIRKSKEIIWTHSL